MGKSRLRDLLCIELERREITASKLQSMGSLKMVLMVTLGPKANKRVMGEPVVST